MGTGILFSGSEYASFQQLKLIQSAVGPPAPSASEASNVLTARGAEGAGDAFALSEPGAAEPYGTGAAKPASAMSGEQLSFSLYRELRTVELQQFAARLSNAGGQSQTLVRASQAVAARFEFSATVSGVVLDGFAKGAEALPEGGADTLASLTDQLLSQADEILNQAFDLLQGFFSGAIDLNELQARFDKFAQDLQDVFAGSTAGGAKGSQQSGVQLEFSFSLSISVSQQTTIQQSDPIVFDLDGDGIELTAYDGGARFDITGRGQVASTSFVTGGDAFLAVDRNGNGQIDNGTELFGDQRGAANGFEALREFDSNKDGRIDKNDKDFEQLKLFRDNGNGKTEKGELIGLREAGIEAIELNYRNVDQAASGGNRIAQIAQFVRVGGTTGTVADALLNYKV